MTISGMSVAVYLSLIFSLAWAMDDSELPDEGETPMLPNELVLYCANFVTDWRTLVRVGALSRTLYHELSRSPIANFVKHVQDLFRYSTTLFPLDSVRELKAHICSEPRHGMLLKDIATPDRILALLDRIEVTLKRKPAGTFLGVLASLAPVKEILSPDFVQSLFYGLYNVHFLDDGSNYTLWDLVEDQHDLEQLRGAFPDNLVQFMIDVQQRNVPHQSSLYRFLNYNGFLRVSMANSSYWDRKIRHDLVRQTLVRHAVPERFADPANLRLLLRCGIRFRTSDVLQITRDAESIRTCWPYLQHLHRSEWLRSCLRQHLSRDKLSDLLKALLFNMNPNNDREFVVPSKLRVLCCIESRFREFMRSVILPNLVNESVDVSDRTLLHCAVIAGAIKVVRFLLTVPNIDVYRRDAEGKLALDFSRLGSEIHGRLAAAMELHRGSRNG